MQVLGKQTFPKTPFLSYRHHPMECRTAELMELVSKVVQHLLNQLWDELKRKFVNLSHVNALVYEENMENVVFINYGFRRLHTHT